MESVNMVHSDLDFLRSAVLLSQGEKESFNVLSRGTSAMQGSNDLLHVVGCESPLEDLSDAWQGGSYHALNVAYEELKHRYNDVQDKNRVLQRQVRGSRAGLEDENLIVRVSPSPQGQMQGQGPPGPSERTSLSGRTDAEARRTNGTTDAHLQVLHLEQTLSLRDREIEDLKHQLDSKRESDKHILELQKEHDQLLKLNHDLTYNNSEQIAKQLQDVSEQLEMTKDELSVLQKDYNVLLQENDTLLKKNLYQEQQLREKRSVSPEKSLINGMLSPVELPDGQDEAMDADDLQEMVVMSMSSKDEMVELKEKVWKLNEVVRILLRQQNERPNLPRISAGLGINDDLSMQTGLGARPKVRSMMPSGPEMTRYAAEMEDIDVHENSPKMRRSQSMQYKKKPKNVELRSRGVDPSTKPKSDIEYTRYQIDNDRGKGHVKYTTKIKLHEDDTNDISDGQDTQDVNMTDVTDIGLPPKDRKDKKEKREKNVFRSEQNRNARPIVDPRKGELEICVSAFDRDSLPAREILAGVRRDVLDNSLEDDLKDLGSDVKSLEAEALKLDKLSRKRGSAVDDLRELRKQSSEVRLNDDDEDFFTLTPAEVMQFEPLESQPGSRTGFEPIASPRESQNPRTNAFDPSVPGSPSYENRNNRRTQVTPNSQSRTNGGNPRPLNIDRNECEPSTVRSYDNTQGLNVNLNTVKDKFNSASSPQGFSILNNDPLVGNKTIPSKNIYQESSDTRGGISGIPGLTGNPRLGSRSRSSRSRTAEEHDDQVVLRACPICLENFESSVSLSEFETHVDECIARNNAEDDDSIVLQEREERMCPMCNRVFSDTVPQEEFETHVNEHFELNFEMVQSSEA